MKPLLTVVFGLFSFASWLALVYRPVGLEQHFNGFEGAFVLYNAKENTWLRHNPTRCAKRFSPCSTFKIPNSLIGLESGVLSGADHYKTYEAQRRPRMAGVSDGLAARWYRDHTLKSAFAHSVVWYYQDLALAVGKQRMNAHLERLDYGNKDTSGGVDRFWLASSLKISADEQVDFLARFYREEQGYSRRSTEIVKKIMVREEKDGYRLSCKTGTDMRGLGWLVGYVETDDNTWFFAYNAQLPKGKRNPGQRLDMVREILRDLAVIPDE